MGFFFRWVALLSVVGIAVWLSSSQRSSVPIYTVVKGRNFLVTGGGSGVGASIAASICEHGGRVYITGRTEAKLARVCQSLKAGCCFYGVHDAAAESGCTLAVEGIDHLILNHAFGRVATLSEIETTSELYAAFRKTFDANVWGNVCLVHQSVKHLRKSPLISSASEVKPTVLFIGSLSHGYGIPRLGFYSGSKAAMIPFLNVWRREMPELSFVHAALGYVATDVAEYMPEGSVDSAMPPNECARRCLEAIGMTGQREVVFPASWSPFVPGWIVEWLFFLAPGQVEEMAARQYGRSDFVRPYNPKNPLEEENKLG